MALRSALVDRGYLHRQRKTVRVVEGRRFYEDTEGPSFRCRLDLREAPERVDEGWSRAVPQPRLLVDKKDSDGNPTEFHIADEILVESADLGTARWQVTAEPEPLRKRRRVIGWQLPLQRVLEPTASAV